MSDETALMKELRIAASQLGARLLRQNTGVGWVGKSQRGPLPPHVKTTAADVLVRNARPLHAGFVGWSDLGGWVPVTITPDMVGQTIARYVQAEVKDGGRPTEEQLRWIQIVQRAGGIAGVVRSEADLRVLLGYPPA